jgi:hypothetical protein
VFSLVQIEFEHPVHACNKKKAMKEFQQSGILVERKWVEIKKHFLQAKGFLGNLKVLKCCVNALILE